MNCVKIKRPFFHKSGCQRFVSFEPVFQGKQAGLSLTLELELSQI